MTKVLKVKGKDWTKVGRPFILYKRLEILDPEVSQNFYFELPVGFAYLARAIRAKWQELATFEIIPAKIGLTRTSYNRINQNEPYFLTLISTPGNEGVDAVLAKDAVDDENFGIEFTATPPKLNMKINEFYFNRDILEVFLDMPTLPPQFETFFIDFLFEGILVPEKTLRMWGGHKK